MTNPEQQEIEAKFVLGAAGHAETLTADSTSLRGFLLSPVTVVTHRDLYLDTADFTLVRSGYALRLRRQDDLIQVGLKSITLGGKSQWHKRLEIEAPLRREPEDEDDLLNWRSFPEEVQEVLDKLLADDQPLFPLLVLQQQRHKRLVSPAAKSLAGAAPFAELSVDKVQVYGVDALPDEATGLAMLEGAAPLATFWEVEAELLPGQDEGQLVSLVAVLERRRGLQPAAGSKFERGLALTFRHLHLEGAAVGQWSPTMTMADACRLIWRRQLAQLLLNEAGVRHSDEDEYVHAMRVAVRRLRIALKLFKPFFRRKPIRRFGRTLRTLGEHLGTVRDYDVALKRLEKSAKQTTGTDGQPEQAAAIASEWQAGRARAFAALVHFLESNPYRRFLAEFARFCAKAGKGARTFDPQDKEGPQPAQVRHVLPVMVAEHYAQIRAFEGILATGEPLSPATLHQLRLRCKRLRYLLEFAQPLLGRSGDRLVKALKHLQDQLGVLNDAAVSQALLADLGEDAPPAVADYHASQQAVIDQGGNEVLAPFADFIGPQSRRLLARTVAQL